MKIPDFMLYIPPVRPPRASPGDVILTPGDLRRLPLIQIFKALSGRTYGKALILCKDISGLKRRSFYSLLIAIIRADHRAIVDDRKAFQVTGTSTARALGHILLDTIVSPFILLLSFLSLIVCRIYLLL